MDGSLQEGEKAMPETHENRRNGDRRTVERRIHAFSASNVAIAGHCKVLAMHITPQGCMTIRNKLQCWDCQGVFAERRHSERRSGIDRRAA